MAAPMRNDPCPCGSGKKYKACCLETDEAVRRGEPAFGPGPHDAEHDGPLEGRVKWIDELMDFAERAHQRVIRMALDSYPRLDDLGEEDEEVEALDEDEEIDWTERWMFAVMFDLPANKEEVVAEAFLRRMGGKLPEEQRTWLEAMVKAPLTPYVVTAIDRGVGFRVQSLANGEEHFLAEPEASEDMEPGDTLAARVALVDGKPMIEGGPYTYPEGSRGAIEDQLRKYVQESGATTFDELELAQRRLFSVVLHALWTELVLTGQVAEDDEDDDEAL